MASKSTLWKLGLGALVVLIAAGLGLLTYRTVRGFVSAQSQGSSPGELSIKATEAAGGDPASSLPGAEAATNPNTPDSQPQLTPWDGAGRVTVLLLGLDYRDWEAGTDASRSDTMILLTLDPLNRTAGMLSIPRDTWVAIPGFVHGKINTAYYLGDAYKLPGGGPGLAVKTVEQFLGVPINYYAQVDFEAFVKFIDEIGGVKIDVPEKITVDLLGSGGKTKKTLKPGVQTLPGEWALAYARARYTEGGDFDRAKRQQQVILGIRNRILSFDMLPTLIAKAPSLYQQLAAGVHTNLALDDVIKLALMAKEVPEESIKHGVFDEKYMVYGWSPDNLSVVIPIPDKITLLRDEIFATSGSLSPQVTGTAQEQMQTEAARLAVYDGSRTPGLADRTAEYLRGLGANVQQVGDSADAYGATTIVDHTGSPYLLKYLVEVLHIQPNRIRVEFVPNSPVDVEVYLGGDWATNNSLP